MAAVHVADKDHPGGYASLLEHCRVVTGAARHDLVVNAEDVRELSADKAYSSVDNHEVLDELGIAAFIPFKDNAVINPSSDAWSRHLCEFLLRQEQWLPHYHRRSNVETVFSMIKAKFGSFIRARRPISQINEVLCKCLAHNLCCLVKAIFVSGRAPTFWADAPAVITSAAGPALALVRSAP